LDGIEVLDGRGGGRIFPRQAKSTMD